MIDRIARFLMGICAIGLAAMAGILCWQVFARYALGSSPAWAEQASLVLIVWIVFLGAAAGVAQGFHVRIVEGIDRLPPAWAERANGLTNIIIVGFGGLLLFWGIGLVLATWANSIPTLPFSRGMSYIVIPFSGAMIAMLGGLKLRKGGSFGGSKGI